MAENGNSSAPAESGSGEAVKFNVLVQYIKDLSFESPNAPQSLQGPGDSPQLEVNVNVGADKAGDDVYEVVLNLAADAVNKTGAIYKLELAYAGLFAIKNLPENMLHPTLFINCPSLLFPFARRIVAEMTQEGAFPPLMLDPIDFASLYKQNLTLKEEEKTGAAES